MKRSSPNQSIFVVALSLILFFAVSQARAQDTSPDKTSRPRTVGPVVQTQESTNQTLSSPQQPVQSGPGQPADVNSSRVLAPPLPHADGTAHAAAATHP